MNCEIGRVTEGAMYDQRGQGQAGPCGARVPRSAHEAWQPPDDRPDPIELLEENNLPRPPTSCRRDYDALVAAAESGRITAARGLLAAPPRGRGLLRAPWDRLLVTGAATLDRSG